MATAAEAASEDGSACVVAHVADVAAHAANVEQGVLHDLPLRAGQGGRVANHE